MQSSLDYRLANPLSNLTYTYSLYHCVQGFSCPINTLPMAPPSCEFYSLEPLPAGFTLQPNGTITCNGEEEVPVTEVIILCDEEEIEIPLQVSVGRK